jgi:hypothetical protein
MGKMLVKKLRFFKKVKIFIEMGKKALGLTIFDFQLSIFVRVISEIRG